MTMKDFTFKVRKEKTQFYRRDKTLPLPPLQYEDVTEPLSDENYERFANLDELTRDLYYRKWCHTAKDAMPFDKWLTQHHKEIF